MKKLIIALFGIAALTIMSAANAVPPTRWTVGPLNLVGIPIGDCGDFVILTDYTVHSDFTLFYDQTGTPIQLTRKVFVENGTSIYYNSNAPSYWLAGGPGERELNQIDATTGIVATTGASYKVMLPGYGHIFINAGRIVLNLITREIYFEAGQQQWYDGDFEALCSALRP